MRRGKKVSKKEERETAGVMEEDINNTTQPSNRRETERGLKGDDREIGGE